MSGPRPPLDLRRGLSLVTRDLGRLEDALRVVHATITGDTAPPDDDEQTAILYAPTLTRKPEH